jgi:hypothetical protein
MGLLGYVRYLRMVGLGRFGSPLSLLPVPCRILLIGFLTKHRYEV